MSDSLSAPKLPICPVCQEAVSLEAANTDEDGHAVHEDCYWARLKRKRGADDSKAERLGTRL